MLTVRDIMTTDVITVTPAMPVLEAAELLAACGANGAPVVDDGRAVGVISATDILAFAAAEMDVLVGRAWWGDLAEEGAGAPSGDTGVPGTFFHESWEDTGADVADRLDAIEEPARDALRWHTVADAMSRELYAVAPGTIVPAAARYMYREHVRRALVMEGTRLVGVVSAMDIARACALRWFTSRLRASGPPAAGAHA